MQCLVDSRQVHVHSTEAAGRAAARPPLLLLHGAGQDHRAWLPPWPALQRAGHALYAPDLPGHSDSAGPPCGSIAELAAWVLELLDVLQLGPCALVGHSMGSLVALHVAALAPQRVSHLGMIGSALPMRVSPDLLQRARSDPPSAMEDIARWSHKSSREQPADPALVDSTLRLMQSVQARWPAGDLLATDLGACDSYADGLEMAGRVRAPVELVLGRGDRMTPLRASSELQQRLPQAHASVLDAGHSLMQEQPAAVARALLDLLERR